MSVKPRRARALAYLVVGLLLAGVFGLRVATAKADTTLGSYSVIASAPGMEFTEDEPTAQAHPEGQGAAPYTTSLLAGGGLGYALSTVAWPESRVCVAWWIARTTRSGVTPATPSSAR